jgi:hypothetical protein
MLKYPNIEQVLTKRLDRTEHMFTESHTEKSAFPNLECRPEMETFYQCALYWTAGNMSVVQTLVLSVRTLFCLVS